VSTEEVIETGIDKVIKLWRELNLTRIVYNFDCGGDSMGETEMHIFQEGVGEIENKDIREFFEEEIYNRVDFYVNSDGEYHGESGTVTITLDKDDSTFNYEKNATGEFTEHLASNFSIKASKKEIRLLINTEITIEGDESEGRISYEKDVALSAQEDKLLQKLAERVYEEVSEHDPDGIDKEGTLEDYFSFATDLEDDKININADYNVRVYRTDY